MRSTIKDDRCYTGDNKRILIVDDEPDAACFFKCALEDNGFNKRVDTFNDPVVALKNFKTGLYACNSRYHYATNGWI